MPLKVTWKKGMRLSTEVFEASDVYYEESIRLSNIIATGGRYGLIPSGKPFELSINVSNNVLEVVSLSCHGVTKSGRLVDIEFDSNYVNTFDTRLSIRSSNSSDAFLIVVKIHDKQWREINDTYSEPKYTFDLININNPVDPDSLPIGMLVNQYGWRLDETDFVVPCLYTDAHPKYQEQVGKAKLLLKSISDRCLTAGDCVARTLIGMVWLSATENLISIYKSQESLTPSSLLAALQKVAAAFVIGCTTDSYISLESADAFMEFAQLPYDAKNLYGNIRRGLDLCTEISVKMESVCAMKEELESPASHVERPKPKPTQQSAPEPKPKVKNRWEGIEI